MAIAGHIVANLTANTTGWSSGLRGAIGPLNAVAAVITGMAAAAVNQFSTFGDEIDKMRSRTGLTAVELSQLSHAAGLSDTSLGSLQSGLTKMQKFMRETSQGTKSAVAVLDELGISAGQLQSATNNEKLGIFADALARIDDPGQRAAVAMEVFGKGAVDLLPLLAGGSAGLREMTDEADRLGLTMSDEAADSAALLNDTIGRLKGTLGGLVTTVGADLAPMVISVVSQFTEWVAENRELIILLAKTAIVMASVVGALKLVTFATQAYAKAQAVASALSGPAGWAKLAIGIGIAAGATALLASEFDSTNRTLDASSMAAEQSRMALDDQADTFATARAAAGEYASQIDGTTNSLNSATAAVSDHANAIDKLNESVLNTSEAAFIASGMTAEAAKSLRLSLAEDGRNRSRAAMPTQSRDDIVAVISQASSDNSKTAFDAIVAEMDARFAAEEAATAKVVEAVRQQTANAKTFADTLQKTKDGLRTSAEATRDEISSIMSEWFAAGSQTKLRLEEINALTKKLAENKSGFTGQFEDITNELRVLRGEITATGLQFEQMAAFGVDQSSLDQLAAMTSERDRLLGEQAAKEKAAEDKRSEMQAEQDKLAATKNKVFESNDTPYAAFAREAKEVQDAIAAGYVKEADGLKYLAQKRAEFLAMEQPTPTIDKDSALADMQAKRDAFEKAQTQTSGKRDEFKARAAEQTAALKDMQKKRAEFLAMDATQQERHNADMIEAEKEFAKKKQAAGASRVAKDESIADLERKRQELLAAEKRLELANATPPEEPKGKQSSNVGLDARSQQANQMIVDLVNRRGAAKDSSVEARKLAAAEAARAAAEASATLLTDIRDEQRRREHIETRPFGQRGQNG